MCVADFHTGSGDPTSWEGDGRERQSERERERERRMSQRGQGGTYREREVDPKRTTSKAGERDFVRE